MIKGGYRIINLGDANFKTGTAVTIPGIYDRFKNSHRKAIMVSGITLGDSKVADYFIQYQVSNGNYTFVIHGRTFTVTHEDKVTIA